MDDDACDVGTRPPVCLYHYGDAHEADDDSNTLTRRGKVTHTYHNHRMPSRLSIRPALVIPSDRHKRCRSFKQPCSMWPSVSMHICIFVVCLGRGIVMYLHLSRKCLSISAMSVHAYFLCYPHILSLRYFKFCLSNVLGACLRALLSSHFIRMGISSYMR